jgi:transcriptional antiterminator NusG
VVTTEAFPTMVNDSTNPDDVPTDPENRTPDANKDGKPSDEAAPEPDGHDDPANGMPQAGAEAPAAEAASAEPDNKQWYVVKVQSGREETIKESIERRVKIDGLEDCFGQIIIPVEKVTEMRNNKRVVKERKLFPGYLMVNVEFNDRILYLFRETSGVGDFVGGGLNKPPQPMRPQEVERLLITQGQESPGLTTQKSKFDKGDKVKVRDGTFAGMEGEVKEVLEAKGALRVELTIFGRPVPVELEYWQVDYA